MTGGESGRVKVVTITKNIDNCMVDLLLCGYGAMNTCCVTFITVVQFKSVRCANRKIILVNKSIILPIL